MKNILSIILLLWIPIMAMGQKPMWVNGYHKDLVNSYIDVFTAIGTTADDARQKALQRVVDERSRATGRNYSISEQNGNLTINSQGDLEVKCRVVDEYYEQQSGKTKVSLLVQTARNPVYSFEPVGVTEDYSAGARVIVPGWAQIYKGQTAKGLVMLAGVVGCGIGALVCENTRSDYKNKMKEQPEFAQTYNTKANNFETARNICIGGAAAFYIWSLIDGIGSKGKRRVIVGKNSSLSLNPSLTSDGGGLSLTYNF